MRKGAAALWLWASECTPRRASKRHVERHPAREACFVRPLSALVALYRMSVLLCTRDAVFLGTPVSAAAHVDIIVRVPEAIQDHSICKLWTQYNLSQLPSDREPLAYIPLRYALLTGLHANTVNLFNLNRIQQGA